MCCKITFKYKRILFSSLLTCSAITAVGTGLLACSSTAPISSQQQARASLATADWLEGQYGFVNNRNLNAMLQRITNRLSNAVYKSALGQQVDPDVVARFKNYPWQIFVLNDLEPNAYSLGSGIIVISKGLIKHTGTEAELAAILCHEMSHVLLGHNEQALQQVQSEKSAPLFNLSLSQEIAADTLGLKILSVAHYDLRSALPAFTIAYRPTERIVSSESSDWITKRAANLTQQLAVTENTLPATVSTREFNRIKRSL